MKRLFFLVTPLLVFGATTFAAVLTYSYTFDGTEPSGPNRLFRNGVASVAGTPKPFPGTQANNPTYFASIAFTPQAGSVVTVTPTSFPSGGTGFLALYTSTFDRLNLSTGYLGDMGASALANVFSINAPGGQLLLVANSINGNSGIGQSFTANIDYVPAGQSAVPEPSTLFLIGLGLAGMLIRRRA